MYAAKVKARARAMSASARARRPVARPGRPRRSRRPSRSPISAPADRIPRGRRQHDALLLRLRVHRGRPHDRARLDRRRRRERARVLRRVDRVRPVPGDRLGAAQRARQAAARPAIRPGARANASATTCWPSCSSPASRSSCGPGWRPTTTSCWPSCGATCGRCRARSRASPTSCASAGRPAVDRRCPPAPADQHDALADARHNLARWTLVALNPEVMRPYLAEPGDD